MLLFFRCWGDTCLVSSYKSRRLLLSKVTYIA